MKIAIGADAYGYPLKLVVAKWLADHGHEVTDVGIHGMEADEKIIDYADAVAGAVSRGEAERGVLLCMSGGAMLIRANRWKGVRAVMGDKPVVVRHDREACDANILVFGGHYETPNGIEYTLRSFMETPFEALDRRVKRLAQLDRETV